MMFNLTDLAKKSVDYATTFSLNFGGEVGTEHLLYGLLCVDCNAQKLLNKYNVKRKEKKESKTLSVNNETNALHNEKIHVISKTLFECLLLLLCKNIKQHFISMQCNKMLRLRR